MVHVDLVAILLGLELASHPLPRLYPELRAPHGLAVLAPANVLAVCVLPLHPIVGAIVGNFEDLIEESVGLHFPCARVLFRECGLLSQPLTNR